MSKGGKRIPADQFFIYPYVQYIRLTGLVFLSNKGVSSYTNSAKWYSCVNLLWLSVTVAK